jgi:hypothetical protein
MDLLAARLITGIISGTLQSNGFKRLLGMEHDSSEGGKKGKLGLMMLTGGVTAFCENYFSLTS